MKVAILGATGKTGSSIVNGLLASTEPLYVRSHSSSRRDVTDCLYKGNHRTDPTLLAGESIGARA